MKNPYRIPDFLRSNGVMRSFLLLLLATTAVGARPNIVFILTDDQAVDTITATRVWEAPELRTPHLDRLVADGTTFANACNMGAWHGAVCVAGRSMLQTGSQLWPTRVVETPGNPPPACSSISPPIRWSPTIWPPIPTRLRA